MSLHDVAIPSPGESITEVEIGNWLKNDGDYVQVDDPLCEIETDKATLPLIADVSGVLRIVLEQSAVASVGDIACRIDTDAVPGEVSSSARGTSVQPPAEETNGPAASQKPEIYASGHPGPAAKKIMEEKGLTPQQVPGTGPGGRITKADVLSQPVRESGPQVKQKLADAPESVTPSQGKLREARRERMSRLRRKLSERLVSVKNETAMLTTFNEVDMNAVIDLRKQFRESFENKHGVRLGFMGFFVKACCEALRDFPSVNSMIDGDELVSHNYIDMGIAVNAPKGLLVPVIRNAESLSLAEIEKEIRLLAKRARENQLSLEEMEGGTFSITNGGVFGSMLSTPILNPPQSAILGMHNIVERPVVVDGEVAVRPVMYLALSYDHRVIDGQQSVSFLVRVKELLETPARIVLGV